MKVWADDINLREKRRFHHSVTQVEIRELWGLMK